MNTKEGLIGVIVPVYKVEKYIAECIDSILAQTYTNFRLILVDDGTPDNAGKICDEYAKKDSRITVIHQENAGVTRARARGVEEAEDCEFITFVDSDDSLPQSALRDLISKTEDGVDIVAASRQDFILEEKLINAFDYRKLIISEIISCGPVAKLYKKGLFTKSTFNIDQRITAYEDLIMNIRLSNECNGFIRSTNKITYHYRNNPDSASHNFKDNETLELLLYYTLKSSFTENELNIYIDDIITHFFRRWDIQFGYNYKKNEWSGWRISKEIIQDINKYKVSVGKIEKWLFITSCPTLRFLLISARKIKNTIRKLLYPQNHTKLI